MNVVMKSSTHSRKIERLINNSNYWQMTLQKSIDMEEVEVVLVCDWESFLLYN